MTYEEVVKHFGGVTATANALTNAGYKISRQAVHKWAHKGVPDDRAEVIRGIMEGK